jgi:hypothetical protein
MFSVRSGYDLSPSLRKSRTCGPARVRDRCSPRCARSKKGERPVARRFLSRLPCRPAKVATWRRAARVRTPDRATAAHQTNENESHGRTARSRRHAVMCSFHLAREAAKLAHGSSVCSTVHSPDNRPGDLRSSHRDLNRHGGRGTSPTSVGSKSFHPSKPNTMAASAASASTLSASPSTNLSPIRSQILGLEPKPGCVSRRDVDNCLLQGQHKASQPARLGSQPVSLKDRLRADQSKACSCGVDGAVPEVMAGPAAAGASPVTSVAGWTRTTAGRMSWP